MSCWGIVGLVMQIETDGARGVQVRVFSLFFYVNNSSLNILHISPS